MLRKLTSDGSIHLVRTYKYSEAALHRCSYKKMFWKYAASLQDNTHAEVWFVIVYLQI